MRYKVYNVTEGRFVTDEHPCWILKPDGSLKINDYGDEVKDLNCIPLFFSNGIRWLLY